MRVGLFCGWLMLCSAAQANQLDLQYLSDVQTNSYLLCSSSMLYFNPSEKTPDPRALTSSFGSLTQLDTRVTQLGFPEELVNTERSIKAEFNKLDGTSRSKSQEYPGYILGMLQLHQRLDGWVEQQYQQAAQETVSVAEGLHEQSLAMAKLLLDYQLRQYPLPAGAPAAMSQAERDALDQAITARFDALDKQYPEQATELGRVRSSYRFVRPQLIGVGGSRSSGGVNFYIVRNIDDLNEMALQVVRAAPAS